MSAETQAPEQRSDDEIIASIGQYEYGWHDSDEAGAIAQRGLNVRLEVTPGGVHGAPGSYVRELEAAVAWLEREAWARSSPAP